jgi:hypothetical protein
MAEAKRRDPGNYMGRPSVLPVATLDRIRELRAEGRSMAKTAAALTAEGIGTATGGAWHASTVRAVQNSAAYAARQVQPA